MASNSRIKKRARMTDLQAESAKEIMLRLGFADKRAEHPWNAIQWERGFGDLGTLWVWNRDWSELLLFLQLSQGYEETITLLITNDLELLEAATVRTIAFLDEINALSQNKSKGDAPA